MALRLFLDSAERIEILAAFGDGLVQGLTTNPSLMARAGLNDRALTEAARELVNEVSSYDPLAPVSIEPPLSDNPDDTLMFARELGSGNVAYKVPIGRDGLRTARALISDGHTVNVTAVMCFPQAIAAVAAGVRYVSIFWGRIADIGHDPGAIVQATRQLIDLNRCSTEVIVGSIRTLRDVSEAYRHGAHVATVPYPILGQMLEHPQTDKIVAQFNADHLGT